MTKFAEIVTKAALCSCFMLGSIPAATAPSDLSRYRKFQLGTDLPVVAKQAGTSASQAKVLQHRPSLIQELEWRPQRLGSVTQRETAKEVVFSFYDGVLFQIVVNYDRYETEGLTGDDLIEGISATYGIADRAKIAAKGSPGRYGDQEDVLAQWQDEQYRFQLIQSAYGPTFRLVGILKRLEAPVQAAIVEAARLDIIEAPQREASRVANDDATERAKLEKARLMNKPKFRP
jgi:hypothetical protein